MNKNWAIKVLQHPDREEIVAKLCLSISATDIHEWLSAKYSNPNEKKFILSEKLLRSFQDNYLDFYNLVQQDVAKTKVSFVDNNADSLELAVKNNPAYKDALVGLATQELDIKKMIATLCINVETRLAQVFDEIQADPRNINTRIDRLLIEYADTFGNILEKYYKFTEEKQYNTVTNYNVTVQMVDQHISVIIEAVREILATIDLDASLKFMEMFHERISKVRLPQAPSPESVEVRHAEAKLLNEKINQKLNE